MSGGGMPSTVTLTDVVLGGSGGGGGTITGISTPAAGGLIGGAGSGIVTLSLTNACTSNQVLQWDGSAWICASVIAPPSGVTLKTNGTLNGSQTLLDLFAGSNLTITDNGAGRDTFNVTGVITGITPSEGLEQSGSNLGLITTCSIGQTLAFDGTHWNCARAELVQLRRSDSRPPRTGSQ